MCPHHIFKFSRHILGRGYFERPVLLELGSNQPDGGPARTMVVTSKTLCRRSFWQGSGVPGWGILLG